MASEARKLAWGQPYEGVVARPSAGWVVLSGDKFMLLDDSADSTGIQPVFPPRGFGGLTDEQLYLALADEDFELELDEGFAFVWQPPFSPHVRISCGVTLWSKYHDPGRIGILSEDLPRRQTALLNAQVLATRLS